MFFFFFFYRALIQQSASIDNTFIRISENNNAIKRRKTVEYPIKENDSLLLLNDQCLLHVFSFLNIFELLQLEYVCFRFSELISSHFYKLQQIVDFNKFKETCKISPRLVLIRIGKYIKEITMSGAYNSSIINEFFEMIPEYCTNVEVLRFTNFQYSCELNLLQYLPIFKNLKILSLRNCFVLEETLLKCLEYAKSLQKLELSMSNKLMGFCLTEIINLTHLSISKLNTIDPANMSELFRNNQTLNYLNISGCSGLNEKNIDDIVKYLINLECLSVSDNTFIIDNQNNIRRLANFVKLKKICLTSTHTIDTPFKELICDLSSNLGSLELFKIPISNGIMNSFRYDLKFKELIIRDEDITDAIVYKILNCMEELTHLTLYYCPKLTNTGIINLIKLRPTLEVC